MYLGSQIQKYWYCRSSAEVLQYCNTAEVLQKYLSREVHVLHYVYWSTASHVYYYYAVHHVSQAPPGRAKCSADPHARKAAEDGVTRKPTAAWRRIGWAFWRALLSHCQGVGPQRIIALMLRLRYPDR